MGNFLVGLHDGLRWIVLIIIVVVLIKLLIGWLGDRPVVKLDRQLWMGLVYAVGIQFILGLIILLLRTIEFGVVRTFWEHASLNIVSVFIIMYAVRFRRLEDRLHHRNKFFAVLASTILIVVAVATVDGWTF